MAASPKYKDHLFYHITLDRIPQQAALPMRNRPIQILAVFSARKLKKEDSYELNFATRLDMNHKELKQLSS